VIDLRDNPGGSGYRGYYLLDCLVEAPYLIAKEFTFKVSDTLRKSRYAGKAGESLHEAKNGEYLTVQKNAMQRPHENSGRFKGQVFCLISERTFSAGVVTAAIFHANRMGITVGQETRGRVTFCSDPVSMTLPNTGLGAQIPLAVYALPGDDPDRGVVPDIEVARKIEDYQKGKDKEMEAVKRVLLRF
jgi:C-terminal processing protease CtpA/Prc